MAAERTAPGGPGPSAVRAPEAGRRLGIPTREVYTLVDAGKLVLIRDARGLPRIPVDSIEAYASHR